MVLINNTMNIITLLTPKSVRQSTKDITFLHFYSSLSYATGDVIEILEGRKKTPAVITKISSVSDFKQEIRSGNFKPVELPITKTGEYKFGIPFNNFTEDDIRLILTHASPDKAGQNSVLKKFLIRKVEKKKVVKRVIAKADSFSEIKLDKYFDQAPVHRTPKIELIDEIRKYFKETARYGMGSFPYYIGMFKKIPLYDIRQMFEEAKRTDKSTQDKKKLFWWKVGNYIKPKAK